MPVAVLYQSPTKQIRRHAGNRWAVFSWREGEGFKHSLYDRFITKKQLASELANGESWQEFREHRLSEKLQLAMDQLTRGIEVFYVDAGTARFNRSRGLDQHCHTTGWYWWACFPGCMPDGDPNGPFDSERGALLDIYENVVEEEP